MTIRAMGVAAGAAVWFTMMAAPASAQTAPGAPPAAQAPAKPDLGRWWEKSSLAVKPMPKKTLLHFDGNLAYSASDGNQDGTTFRGAAGFDVRRGRVTEKFDADLSKQDMTYGPGGGKVDTSEDTLQNLLDVDITPHVLVLAGFEHYRNTSLFIDHRVTYFVGAGATLLQTAKHAVNVTGGIGYAQFAFDRDAMLSINPAAVESLPTTSPSGGGMNVVEVWHTVLPDKMVLSQQASYMDYFDDDLGHVGTFNLNLSIPISKHFTIGPAVRVHNEVNIYATALHVKPTDKSFSFTLGVSF